MKTRLTIALCATILMGVQPNVVRADNQPCEQKCILKKDVAEALVHVVTHLVSLVGAGVLLDGGAAIDAIAGHNKFETFPLGGSLGLIAGAYTVYNMPQWTDTYVLGKAGERTRSHNVIVFISRLLFFLGPIGVMVGEAFNAPLKDATAASSEVRTLEPEIDAESNE